MFLFRRSSEFQPEQTNPALYDDWGKSALLRSPPLRHHRILVISDLHFPRSDSHPKYLYEFLRHNTCDTLVLLGDTHEGYDHSMAEWKEMHMRVWDLINARKAQGMRVIDVPGNHDMYKFQSGILGHKAFGTEYRDEVVVDSAIGKTLLLHGHQFDGNIIKRFDKALYKAAKKIAWGDKSLVNVHTAIGVVWDYMFTHAGEHCNDLKTIFAAASLARERGCDAVLTGHTHTSSPFLPVEKLAGVFYGNAGGWVGRRGTAKAQTHTEWCDIDWRKERAAHKPAGEEVQNLHRSYRDQTIAELRWQKAQHFVYAQEKIIKAARDELGRIEKARRRTLEFLSRAEEKLFRTQETLKEINKSEASLEALPLPAPPIITSPHL